MPLGGAVIGAGALGALGASSGGKKGGKGAAKAADLQLQGVRESLAMQSRMADKGYNVFAREAENARGFLREQEALAREELQPLKEIGLRSLTKAEGYTNPNSAESNAERVAYQKMLAANLSARGLTASGTEMAGLSDFELGLARERRNMTLGLAGQGANTLQSLSQLRSGLGTGLSNITAGFGQSALSLYGGAGAGMANTIGSGYAGAGSSLLAQGQMQAQGLMGIGNALQGTASNLVNLSLYRQMMGGGGGGYTPLFGNGGF